MKTLRRVLYWGIGLAGIGAAAYLSLRARPVLVDVSAVEMAPMDVRVEEDGKSRIRERYVVSTPLTGRLQRITLDVGDHVIAGQTVLARLQSTDPEFLDPRRWPKRALESAQRNSDCKQPRRIWRRLMRP